MNENLSVASRRTASYVARPERIGVFAMIAAASPGIQRACPRSAGRRLFSLVATVLICFIVFAAFRAGIVRDLHSTLADQSWSRVQFAIGAAITSLYHGGYGYTVSDVLRQVLANAGLTGDPAILKTLGVTFPDNLRNPGLIENAIEKAIAFQWPFNPDQRVTGSSGEDVGLVDYVRLSFILFGHKAVAFFLTYFAVVSASLLAAIVAFRKTPGILAVFVLYAVALLVLFNSNLLDLDLVGILDPRFLSTLSVIPAAHIALVMLVRPRPSAHQVALAILQSAILVFGYWIRSSAFWTFLGLLVFAVLLAAHALWRRRPWDLMRTWPFAVLALLAAAHFTYVAQTLHPVYSKGNERPHHALWHAMIYGVAVHPDWPRKYAAQFGLENVDDVPEVVAKKYLLRHPPANPEDVYLTRTRNNLRTGAAETYKRKAFLEFFANDPQFVLEAFLIYNVKLCQKALAYYASSFDRLSTLSWMTVIFPLLLVAAFLFPERDARWSFLAATLIVSAGFLVAMAPMLLTAPGTATMADQFLMLIVAVACWLVVAMSWVLAAVAATLQRIRSASTKRVQLVPPI
jgi:hypothetical protein